MNDEGVVWKRGRDEGRFMEGREGDHLLFPFQCDKCWFRNLKLRSPDRDRLDDNRLLGYIRRVNLDGMWARSPATVGSNLTNIKKSIRMMEDIGIPPLLPIIGPWPVADGVGFSLALAEVRASQERGRNNLLYQQYDTVRKMRSAASNVYEVSYAAARLRSSYRGPKGEVLQLSSCPTQSLLFTRFSIGLLSRMGRDTKSNLALDYKLLHLILGNLEEELRVTGISDRRKRWLVIVGFGLLIGFVLSLRGNEIFFIELGGLLQHLDDGTYVGEEYPHVVIPLLGRFKNEVGERWHLMLAAERTNSGFEIGKWTRRVAKMLKLEGKTSGPVLCNEDGSLINAYEIDAEFHRQLVKIQEGRPDLLHNRVNVETEFSIFRSLRRGSTSRATEVGVSQTAIDLQNRWRTVEYNKGGGPRGRMRDHYTEIRLARKRLITYSSAM